jgi:hypothetical protein
MFVDWNDPRQACTMVYSGDIAYPSSAPDSAARARAAMPCLLKRSKSKFAIYRDVASPMLVEAIAKAQGTLDAETAQAATQIVLSNLRDPDVGVRGSTALALSKFGGRDMICFRFRRGFDPVAVPVFRLVELGEGTVAIAAGTSQFVSLRFPLSTGSVIPAHHLLPGTGSSPWAR